jgi:HlyD family secretion protein
MTEQQIAPPEQQEEAHRKSRSAPEPPAPSKDRRRPLVPIVIIVIVAGGTLIAWRLLAQPKTPDNIVILSGRMEGDDSAVSPKTGGRIVEIRVREGDSMKAGDVVATLDDQQIRARQQQAEASVKQADARVRSARQQIAVLQDQLLQAQLQTEQARTDSSGRVHQSEGELAAAEAELAQQEAALQLKLFDRDAYTRLAKSGAVSERQGKEAVTNAETQEAAVAAARRRLEAARGSLNVAKANLANPAIRSAQSAGVRNQIAQQQAEVASAGADAERARAELAEAQANRQDLTVRAPFDGTVATRTAEPGEVVQAGTAIVTLIDLSKVYLRGFVPEGQIGKVKVGQAARVYLDSNPRSPLDAYVSRVDPQATFTPENTYFRDDRVKQVVGMKLQLKSGIGYAKPGMPADGEILVAGDRWPEGKYRR